MPSRLTAPQIAALTTLRHALHKRPEISGEEAATAGRITRALDGAGADRIWTGLGGHGVAAEFRGSEPGPTLLFRCELDALPIEEISDLPYRSEIPGRGHLCGHDGHMAMIMGLAHLLASRPAKGRVIVLFQPAEETGAGAAAVIADPRWPDIRPDYAFAFHNTPGRPLGELGLCSGAANCASRGMQIRFSGTTSHAAAPGDGLSPAAAMARLMLSLPELGSAPGTAQEFCLATLTHASLGEPTFGVAPGEGALRVTLRSESDAGMARMIAGAEQQLAEALAEVPGLTSDVTWHEVFLATVNAPEAIAIAETAGRALDMPLHAMSSPMRWSEDFGRFALDGACAALLFLGSGEDQPQLHNPDFDFPDALLPRGVHLLAQIVTELLS